MSRKLIIIWILFGLFWVVPMAVRAQVPIERSTEIITISGKQYYMHHVKQGETLYSLARVYQVTQDEILRLNPEINDLGLQAEMVIGIPVVLDNSENSVTSNNSITSDNSVTSDNSSISLDTPTTSGYVVYTIEEAEKTRRLLRRLEIDEEEFRKLNPAVGSRVFVGQKVLIPSNEVVVEQPQEQVPDTIVIPVVVTPVDTVVEVEEPTGTFVLSEVRPQECYPLPANAQRHYHVALLVPLYLDDIDRIDASKAKAEKSKNLRAMKFLQFYEGFMMAVDSLTQKGGMRLDLTVIDVHENVASARAAVNSLQNETIDLIVGPFFSKSFAVVEDYALRNNIPVVNPMSERESIIVDAPNVIKLKPSTQSMLNQLADLMVTRYPQAKVSLVVDDNTEESELVSAMERLLDSVVARDVTVTNSEILQRIAQESRRRNMGKRMLSTMEAEGQIFSTKALQEDPEGTVFFENRFQSFSSSEIDAFQNSLSSARENVLIAYGDDIVFATKILNTINKSAQKYPITLIGLPSWEEFDNLLVPNLLNMNAIYFEDHFADYNDSLTLVFVDAFRVKYSSEPSDYAFEGFDVGWYFLNSLMKYGPHFMDCIPYEHMPLLHTGYYFTKKRFQDGLENRYWNMYQYDSRSVELKPVRIYQSEEE